MSDKTQAARDALLADEAARQAAGTAPAPAAPAAPDTPPAGVESTPPPLIPLGNNDGQNVYYSRPYARLFRLAPEKHTRLNLLNMATLADFAAWLRPDLTPDGVEKHESKILHDAARRLIEATAGRQFNPAAVRERGIWRDTETAGVIYNTGRECYLAAPGRPLCRVEAVRGGYIYTTGKELPAPADSPLSNKAGAALVAWLNARTWAFRYSGILLAGFICNAILAGALPFRGHIWINAPRNTGKTALRDDLLSVFDSFCCSQDGAVSTPAALRAELHGAPLPVVGDEQDAAAGDARAEMNREKKLELARIASKGGKVSMGTQGGGIRDYTLLSCFLFLSVDNALIRDTDLSRWGVLQLRACNAAELDALLDRQAAARASLPADIAGALITRLLMQAPAYFENLPPLMEELRRGGCEPRRAEMMAVWLAGAHALTIGGRMDASDIAASVKIAQAYGGQDDSTSDFYKCIACLLACPVPLNGIRYSVETLCAEHRRGYNQEARIALESKGIFYEPGRRLMLKADSASIQGIFWNTEYSKRAVSVLSAGCYRSKPNEYGVRITTKRAARGAAYGVRFLEIPVALIEYDFEDAGTREEE